LSDTDLQDLIDRLSTRVGERTPIELLRIEVKFLTSLMQALLANIAPFAQARHDFFTQELTSMLEELDKPRIHLPNEEMM